MFPAEAVQPWIPLFVGAFVLLAVIGVIAGVVRNRLARVVVILPVVAFAAKLAWGYMLANGI